jgi:hypothetical protein
MYNEFMDIIIAKLKRHLFSYQYYCNYVYIVDWNVPSNEIWIFFHNEVLSTYIGEIVVGFSWHINTFPSQSFVFIFWMCFNVFWVWKNDLKNISNIF